MLKWSPCSSQVVPSGLNLCYHAVVSDCLKSCCSVKDIDINLIVNSISSNAFLMVTIVKWAKAHFLKHVRISFRAASHDDRAWTASNLKFIQYSKLFLVQAKCCPSNNQEQIFESTRWRTTRKMLSQAITPLSYRRFSNSLRRSTSKGKAITVKRGV